MPAACQIKTETKMTYITLSQLQNTITAAVAASPVGRGAWVAAELSDVRVAGGHCYMELIEKDARGTTVAKMRGTIWRNALHPLDGKFFAATGSHIVTGLKVLLHAVPQNHPLYGMSLNIIDIDPSYTLGDMERIRREILMRLQAEGILNHNKSLPLSEAPQRIAVISAAGAAGYGDFADHLSNNPDALVFYPALFEAVMQGNRTSATVRAALERIEQSIDFWDAVVIIRGGGATSDLAGFDDYELARAVAMFPIPIIVGIGHERDRTVLDEIACVRCKTPTAVAAFLLERNKDALQRAIRLAGDITRYAMDALSGEQRRLSGLGAVIPTLVRGRIDAAAERLRSSASILPVLAKSRTEAVRRKLDDISCAIPDLLARRLSTENDRLRSLLNLTEAYSPANTLRRGYSITLLDGHALRNSADAPAGATLVTRLADGSITSVVK